MDAKQSSSLGVFDIEGKMAVSIKLWITSIVIAVSFSSTGTLLINNWNNGVEELNEFMITYEADQDAIYLHIETKLKEAETANETARTLIMKEVEDNAEQIIYEHNRTDRKVESVKKSK